MTSIIVINLVSESQRLLRKLIYLIRILAAPRWIILKTQPSQGLVVFLGTKLARRLKAVTSAVTTLRPLASELTTISPATSASAQVTEAKRREKHNITSKIETLLKKEMFLNLFLFIFKKLLG
jgi:hypothetical protein